MNVFGTLTVKLNIAKYHILFKRFSKNFVELDFKILN